jgi:uncharacterized protein with GYD domain
MPHYLHQVSYTPEAWARLIATPQDRIAAIRTPIEKLGGRIDTAFFAFGDYDVVVITDMPDNVSAAAIAIAFAAGGAVKTSKTTPLISTTETLEALKKAATSGYRSITMQTSAAAEQARLHL